MNSAANGLFTPRAVMGAAIVGLLGAAGMFLVEQIYSERRRVMLAQDLARLDQQVASMRQELHSLRELQNQRTVRKPRSRSSKKSSEPPRRKLTNTVASSVVSDTDYTTEYASAAGTDLDVSSEEFYDMSSDSEVEEPVKNQTNGKPQRVRTGEYADVLITAETLLYKSTEADIQEAFKLLNEIKENGIKSNSDEAIILCFLGKCCQQLSHFRKHDNEARKKLIFEGIEYCKMGLEKDPLSSECNKWYATMVGLRGEFVSTKAKIEDGQIFKKHVDEALRLDPEDYGLHHLLGRYKYEIASLTWLERRVGSAIYGSIPTFTYESALTDFLKAEELNSGWMWKENSLLIAKCMIASGDTTGAVKKLEDLIKEPMKIADDYGVTADAQVLLDKYKK